MDESNFHVYVEKALRDRYEAVTHEPTLKSGREPDFLVETLLFDLVIEVEYAADDVIEDVIRGAGQAINYAGELSLGTGQAGVVPVVICNTGGLDRDCRELDGLRSRIPVVPIDATGQGGAA